MLTSEEEKAQRAAEKLERLAAQKRQLEEAHASAPATSAARPSRAREPGSFLAHDGLVPALALVLLVVGAVVHAVLTAPKLVSYTRAGLSFTYPAGWSVDENAPEGGPVNVHLAPLDDPSTHIDVSIRKKPRFDGPLESALELMTRGSYGELSKKLASQTSTMGGREWVRSVYTYAHLPSPDDAPQLASAVEYAAVNNDSLIIVTLHGRESELAAREHELVASLSLK